MITRIEIDGFKSFVDFELEVPPFLVVMGGNASGKSNLVDALTVLTGDGRRGQDPFDEGLVGDRGIPAELFHQFDDGTRASRLKIAVECDVPQPDGVGPDKWRISRRALYDEVNSVIKKWEPTGYTEIRDDPRSQAGGFDNELASWIPLSLVPQLMRERGLVTDRRHLQIDGSNLASVLGRIADSAGAEWQELLADAVALLPELRDIRVERSREYWDLEFRSRGSGWMSSRTASDGALRVLAVLAAAHDPRGPSVVIVDEVENGLHPSRLAELVRRLRSITHASRESGPLRQIIVTTHSPVVLSALYPEYENEVVFLATVFGPYTVDGKKVGSMRTVVRPVGGAGLPREIVRGLLGTVRPLEPRL